MKQRRRESVCSLEFAVSLLTWTSGVVYAHWSLFHVTWTHDAIPPSVEDGTPDSEWVIFSRLLSTLSPAFVAHLLATRYLESRSCPEPLKRFYRPQRFHVAFTIVVLVTVFGLTFANLIACVLFLLAILSYVNCALFTWIIALSLVYLVVLSDSYYPALDRLGIEANVWSTAVIAVLISWTALKFVSLSRDGAGTATNLCVRLGYLFYFPTLFVGPLILFPTYNECLRTRFFADREKKRFPSCERTEVLLYRLFRSVIWGLVLDYLYSHWDYDFSSVPESWDLWAVCGLGLWLGGSFQMKYVVFYGVPSTFALLEGVDSPLAPACIFRIHRYSDMWRKFDSGLNKFLVKYVYVPVTKSTGVKFFGICASFALVACWHAATKSVIVWVVTNAVGIMIEAVLDSKLFPIIRSVRLKHVILCVLLAASVQANFFFLGEFEVGNDIFWRVVHCSIVGKFFILFFLYHCCVVSAYVHDVES
jgi:hypothetical protein